MLKRFGIPALALTALLILLSPGQAAAEVHFGVSVGPAYAYPAPYSYPGAFSYPYGYDPYYVNPYPAYPYAAPYGGLGFYWGGGYGGYGHQSYDHGYRYDRGYRGGHEFHEHSWSGGGHRR